MLKAAYLQNYVAISQTSIKLQDSTRLIRFTRIIQMLGNFLVKIGMSLMLKRNLMHQIHKSILKY